jgi:hypothetical protein
MSFQDKSLPGVPVAGGLQAIAVNCVSATFKVLNVKASSKTQVVRHSHSMPIAGCCARASTSVNIATALSNECNSHEIQSGCICMFLCACFHAVSSIRSSAA